MFIRYMTIWTLPMLMILNIVTAQPQRYEEKADDILTETRKVLQAHEALRMDFSYSFTHEQRDENDQMEGFILTKNDKYYFKQGMHHFISDGITVWSFLEEVNEVHISYAEDTEEAISPASILDNFREEYRSTWIRQESTGQDPVHIIDLVPHQPQTFYKFRVGVCNATKHIVYTEAHDRQGGIYRYDIEKIDTSPEIPENKFTFQVEDYPDIEVVDMR